MSEQEKQNQEREKLRTQLVERGVWKPDEILDLLTLDAVRNTIRWYDDQHNAGPGLLVSRLRAGGTPTYEPPEPKSLEAKQADYCDDITEWVAFNFPDLMLESGNPHPAAFVKVTHLHQQHGRRLVASEHEQVIRRAVSEYCEKWDIDFEGKPLEKTEAA